MTSRLILRVAPALLLSALAFPAAAAPKDAAATTKIDEAINVHYLATDFTKAEAQLLGVVKACGKDCSPNVLGRAWMYVGLVRGSGKQDLAGARDAFTKAKEMDPATQIDTALATPEVQAEYDAVFGGAAAPAGKQKPAGAAAAPATDAAAPADAEPGELDCTVDAGSEIETRRPIPISCSMPEGANKAVLAYKEPGAAQFSNIPMSIQEGNAKGAIPCSATKMAGPISFVIVVKDATGGTLGSVGSLEQPAQLNVVQTTLQPPPAFPGEAPPARCAEEVECPPGMPGCTRAGGGGWGDACTPAEPCKKGLFCSEGTCENAPTCEVDGDCSTGRCSEGFCEMDDGSASSGSGGYRKMWVGLHFAPDIYLFSSDADVCNIQNLGNHSYSCYEEDGKNPLFNDFQPPAGSGRVGVPTLPGGMGKVNGGPKLATMRLLASFDYAITANLMVGGRVGFAFGGGPKTYNYTNASAQPDTIAAGKSFFPVHVEPRLTYHIVSLGKQGLHPYVHVGGGIAQVDAKMTVQVCNNGNCTDPAQPGVVSAKNAVVYKRVGQGFVTLGGGLLLPLAKNFGAQLNVNLMYMLPDSGIVIQPSLGAVLGF